MLLPPPFDSLRTARCNGDALELSAATLTEENAALVSRLFGSAVVTLSECAFLSTSNDTLHIRGRVDWETIKSGTTVEAVFFAEESSIGFILDAELPPDFGLEALIRRVSLKDDPDEEDDGGFFSGLLGGAGGRLLFSSGRGERSGALPPITPVSPLVNLPDSFPRGLAADVTAGTLLNLLDEEVGLVLGKKEKGANFTLFQDDEGYRATLDVPVGAKLDFPGGALAFEISRFRLEQQLYGPDANMPVFLLTGRTAIGQHDFAWGARLDLYYRELRVEFTEFPTLGEMIETLSKKQEYEATSAIFAEDCLGSILSVTLSRFSLIVDIPETQIVEVSATVSGKKPIPLCGDKITIRPELSMSVIRPFVSGRDAYFRQISGEVRGVWEFGHARFTTSLALPDLGFLVEKDPDTDLSLNQLGTELGWSLDLGERDLALTVVRIAGNMRTRSFDADIAVKSDDFLNFEVGGQLIKIDGLSLAASVTDGAFHMLAVEGVFAIGNVHFVVSGSYRSSESWKLYAATAPDSVLPVGEIANTLLGGVELPDEIRSITLTDVILSASLGSGGYRVSARTSRGWEIIAGLEVAIEEFRVEKQGRDEEVEIALALLFDFCDNDLRLGAQKSKDEKEAWTFAGELGKESPVRIKDLEAELKERFGLKSDLPDVLESLDIESLSATYCTAPKSFAFTLAGRFWAETDDALFATVEILIQQDGKGRFGGSIQFGGVEFELVFETAKSEKTLSALFKRQEDARLLSLSNLAAAYGLADATALSALPDVARAAMRLEFGKSSRLVALDCALEDGKAAGLLAWKINDDRWRLAAAARLPVISTSGLGDLGSIIEPHELQLKDLLVSIASADPQKPLSLAGEEFTVNKGFLLTGNFALTGTDTELPFECRLGGDEERQDSDGTADKSQGTGTQNDDESNALMQEANNNSPVGRSIGPLTFRKVRYEMREERVCVLLDASLGSSLFKFDLDGLNASLPVTSLLERSMQGFEVGLDGLAIDVSTPTLGISGGLVRRGPGNFVGDILIKASKFQISAFGAYSAIDTGGGQTAPSVFIYGSFNGVLGGPPAFFVTGVALGGGYNSKLETPGLREVQEFPLVAAVMSPPGKRSGVRENLEKYIQPSHGDYWGAVGVRFTSFKLADSFALLTVAFGNRLRFTLLGISEISQPEGKTPAFRANLAIRAVLDPEAGVLSIEGRLTKGSFVFSEKLRLEGGFAFFVWFGGPNAGDFVISIGGYHPDARPPAHYPVVERVSIGGRLSSNLRIRGESYFAITPSCMMAGIRMEAVFNIPTVRAAFLAYADFFIAWAPFHYDARIGISISIIFNAFRKEVTATSSGLKLEIGADLHVWGPPFAGMARISYWCVSFSVKFGNQSTQAANQISWNDLCERFLPTEQKSRQEKQPNFGSIALTGGIVREVRDENGKVTHSIMNAHELVIETESTIPCTEISVGAFCTDRSPRLGVLPMGKGQLRSKLALDIFDRDGSSVVSRFMVVSETRKSFPSALWSTSADTGQNPEQMIRDVLSGVIIRTQPTSPKHRVGPFPIEEFQYDSIPKEIRLSTEVPSQEKPQGSWEELSQLLGDSGRQSRVRDQLSDVLRSGKPAEARLPEVTLSPALVSELQAASGIGTIGSAP